MKCDSEAVRFVANHLDKMEHGRVAVKDYGIVFLAEDVDDLLFLGDGSKRLVGDAQLVERLGRGMKLAQAAVDQNEAGKRLVFVPQALVAAGDHLTHGSEIIDSGDGTHDELAVFALVHPTVLPDHHGGDSFGALDV